MKNKKYNEYKVTVNSEGEIVQKMLTDRGHVMIPEIDAIEMNLDYTKTKIFYEDAKVSEKAEREAKKIKDAEVNRIKTLEAEIEKLKAEKTKK